MTEQGSMRTRIEMMAHMFGLDTQRWSDREAAICLENQTEFTDLLAHLTAHHQPVDQALSDWKSQYIDVPVALEGRIAHAYAFMHSPKRASQSSGLAHRRGGVVGLSGDWRWQGIAACLVLCIGIAAGLGMGQGLSGQMVFEDALIAATSEDVTTNWLDFGLEEEVR
jgi:hypothetical protein